MTDESATNELGRQNEHWQQIFNEATARGNAAASRCVPVPIQIDNNIFLDGESGGAGIEFPRASVFGQWLVLKEIANSYDPDDATEDEVLPDIRYYILDDSGSADRAQAHARAFVEALNDHGIINATVVRLLN